MDFLTRLQPSDTWQVGPVAQEALADARLARITDPQLRIEFLEGIATDRAPATHWAVEQLCNSGALASRGIVQQSIRRSWPDKYGEDQIRFCEARMQVVSRYPDRAKALGSVLSVENIVDDDRLIRWAIYQLAEVDSPDATAVLDRFAGEIGKLPNSSPQKRRWSGFKQEIELWKQRHHLRELSASPKN
jgi:hypothetical protein